MKSILDRFNIKLVDEGVLIYGEQGSRQNVKILAELVKVLGELLAFAQFMQAKSRHLGSLERALDEEDRAERREKFEAECDNAFNLYKEKFAEMGEKAARKYVRENMQLTCGQQSMMIGQGRKQAKAREKGKEKTKPRAHRRRRDRLDPSLQKFSGRRAEKLFEQKRRQLENFVHMK